MMRKFLLSALAISVIGVANAKAEADDADKQMGGMSIVGNDEAPKSLVIVPWKASELGRTLQVSRALDDSPHPVDREVFLRDLAYYEIRAGARPAPARGTQ